MSDNSSIEWTDATWNVVTGCVEVSPGCDHCYAKTFAERWRGVPGHHFEQGFDVVLRPERLDLPLRWKKPRRVFVNSMSDLFHDAVPDLFITRVFEVMEQASEHTFQVLTKRHARMRSFVQRRELDKQEYAPKFDHCPTVEMRNSPAAEYARNRAASPPANIWLGVSVENQQWADIRIPALLDTPAAVRWISAEPLLGPINLQPDDHAGHGRDYDGDYICLDCSTEQRRVPWRTQEFPPLDWVVVGGESGPGSRPMHPDWARGLRDQCTSASVPFFYKQTGQFYPVDSRSPALGDTWVSAFGATMPWEPGDGHVRNGLSEYRYGNDSRAALMCRARSKHDAGRSLDGRTWDEYPSVEPAVSR